ncbi:MAG: hypothetical protein ACJ8CB_31750 [Ktedonobacteraceae bacterium]
MPWGPLRILPWTAPSTLPRSGSHGVLAHQQRAGELSTAGRGAGPEGRMGVLFLKRFLAMHPEHGGRSEDALPIALAPVQIDDNSHTIPPFIS